MKVEYHKISTQVSLISTSKMCLNQYVMILKLNKVSWYFVNFFFNPGVKVICAWNGGLSTQVHSISMFFGIYASFLAWSNSISRRTKYYLCRLHPIYRIHFHWPIHQNICGLCLPFCFTFEFFLFLQIFRKKVPRF